MDACWSHDRRFQQELQMFEKEKKEKKEKETKQSTAHPYSENLLYLS